VLLSSSSHVCCQNDFLICVCFRLPNFAAGVGTIEVHQGFYQGAKRQLPEIQRVVAAHANDGGKRLPVWSYCAC